MKKKILYHYQRTYKMKVHQKYDNISLSGNEVIIKPRNNDLKTFRAILNSFSGYVYSQNNSVPTFDDFGRESYQVKKLNLNDIG